MTDVNIGTGKRCKTDHGRGTPRIVLIASKARKASFEGEQHKANPNQYACHA
jgi:hypothetical protein